MRRIAILAAAAAMLLAPLAAAGQDRGHDRRERGGYRGAGMGYRGGERPQGYAPGPEAGRYLPPRAAPPPSYAGQGRSWRQGQYLPPMYRGAPIRDPGRFRLRAPPPGYDWLGVGPDIYLVQRNSGLVLDTIPGGF